MNAPADQTELPSFAQPRSTRWPGMLGHRATRLGLGLAALALVTVGAVNSGVGRTKAVAAVPDASPSLLDAAPAVLERVTMKASAETLAAQNRLLARTADLTALRDARPDSPEARLMHVYTLMSEGHGQQALDEAQRLTNDIPTFGLAQLVYADLLSALSLSNPGYATYPPTLRDVPTERLDDLTAEARARVTAAGSRPPAGAVPSQFVFLAPSVRYAIAVDVSKSRLYVLENTPAGPVVTRDYYASVGKLGTSKRVEGDLRTPLGVYFVTGSVAPGKLAERFGAGALPLNYPNQLDQMRGRTGSGIWLHGVEPATFTRAPLATDGCVAVSNPDLRELRPMINRQSTPVVIAESLQWVAVSQAPAKQSDFMTRFEAWRQARQSASDDLQTRFYSQSIHTPGAALAASAASTESPRADRAHAGTDPVSVNNLSVLSWHDEDDVMIVTYTEVAKHDAAGHVKRQYWLRQAGDWNIIFEGPIS